MLNASKHEARPKISSPKAYGLRRAVEDYDFDRLEVEAQQCVELTSTNRPFGLIIKLTQTVNRSNQSDWVSSLVKSAVRSATAELVMPAKFLWSRAAVTEKLSVVGARAMPYARYEFPVVIPRGSHPFPSRTR